jgi:predicted RNA-binding protein with PUA-like domain
MRNAEFALLLVKEICWTVFFQESFVYTFVRYYSAFRMNYWLVKSEPDVYSFDQLMTDGETRWDGVRNYQARNNLRAMQAGDICLYYHSNIGLEVVGLAQVAKTAFPDPTAEKGDWSAVMLVPLKPLNRPVPLAEIKAHPALEGFGLVRNGRLSVMPASSDEFFTLLSLGDTEL